MWTAEWWITLFKDDTDYKKAKLIYNHGQSEKYFHTELGYNFRMTNIQAAIWSAQLLKLSSLNNSRIENAKLYNSILEKQNTLQIPQIIENQTNVFHQYTVLVKQDSNISRKQIQERLKEKWIPTAIHYPIPIHKQPYYSRQWYDENICSNTNYLCENIFSLPIYPWLKKEEIEYIANNLLEIIK
jgi:perosamine synthetase